MAADGYVIVGRIRRAHGLRGELVVEPLTGEPDAFFASGRRLFAGTEKGDLGEDPAVLHVSTVRPFGAGYLVGMQEVAGRSEAEEWRGRYLLVPADEVSAPGEGEVFVHELRGMRVQDMEGVHRGEVTEVYELPQGLALEVTQPSGARTMVPFLTEMIAKVDRDARLISVSVPEGLFDI